MHRITSLRRWREVPLVQQEFRRLMPGWCLEQGVRHFMTSFGIRNEGGRLLFPRREQARSDEAVARLIFDHATVLVEAEDQRRQSNKNWSQV